MGSAGCCAPATMLPRLKRAAEAALTPFAALLAQHRTARRETLVLAWHNIVPTGSAIRGEASLHLPQYLFAAQLDLLLASHQVIPLDALRERPYGRKPRAVITFDDAYTGALTAGIEELDRRRIPATCFIAPGFIPGRTFWWDEAAAAGVLSPESREHAITDLMGDGESIREEFGLAHMAGVDCADVGGLELPDHTHAADLAALEAAAAVPGITFGSHTWNHLNIARIGDEQAIREMAESRRWLDERFCNITKWISFPYGRTSARCNRIAEAGGYDGALLIEGGWVGSADRDAFVIPRLNVPGGLSVNGLRLRTAGMLVS